MSSSYVRTEIKNYLTTNLPTEKIIDLTASFQDLQDFLYQSGLTTRGPWIGVQFVPSDEIPVTVQGNLATERYLETGIVYIHIVGVAIFGVADSLLTRAEAVRDLIRGKRIGEIVIQSVTPPNFSLGATLAFEDGYTACSVIAAFDRQFYK